MWRVSDGVREPVGWSAIGSRRLQVSILTFYYLIERPLHPLILLIKLIGRFSFLNVSHCNKLQQITPEMRFFRFRSGHKKITFNTLQLISSSLMRSSFLLQVRQSDFWHREPLRPFNQNLFWLNGRSLLWGGTPFASSLPSWRPFSMIPWRAPACLASMDCQAEHWQSIFTFQSFATHFYGFVFALRSS